MKTNMKTNKITFNAADAREFNSLRNLWPEENTAVKNALWDAGYIDENGEELAKRANKLIAEQYDEELAEAEKNPGDYIADHLLNSFGDPIADLLERLQDGEIDDADAEGELESLVYDAITEALADYSRWLWNHGIWEED